MSKKTNGIQVGNFIVTRDNGSEHDWISIKAVSGFWSMRFRDDNEMFERIRLLANNKDFSEYMETWIKVNFLMANCTPDAEFMKDFFEAYTKMNERLLSRRKQISEEEDKAILEQEKATYELKEQAKQQNEGSH
ncbi:hypothetical protein [Bacteroides thetaiotaomicron]|uniref:hypothetical protein n=1 Tax=Bacteroides thetaiotaomicron TaxID=818 RepID=UPI00232E13C1|nr:hypothetical protein [Bacteroides thetaiotaomicron]MDC2181979.1 hypothetical protein [Bacteroides thetaiotaomicron]MDC2197446.1 hypothetical protein [Bacteroides thetaiotaomicron]